MICTITPPPDCLARLAACPALPRGERLEWAQGNRAPGYAHRIYRGGRGFLWLYASRVGAHRDSHTSTAGQTPEPTTITTWRSMARPLRVARQKLREARTHTRTLEQVCAQQKQRIQALVRGEL